MYTEPPVSPASMQKMLSIISTNDGGSIELNKLGNQPNVNAGFTIANVKDLLDSSLGRPQVVGWFVMLRDPSTTTPKQLEELTLRELTIIRDGTTLAPGINTLTSATFLPMVVSQLQDAPAKARTVSYAEAQAHYGTRFWPATGLDTSDLAHYTDWGNAAFLRRTDLEFLQIYLNNKVDGCNDLFFSGAFTDFHTMNNPVLRVFQHNLPGPGGTLIENSSQAFTLKVEPFINNFPDLPGRRGGEITSPGGTSKAAAGTAASAELVRFPVSQLMLPCPDYWEIQEGTLMAAQSAYPGIDEQALLDLAYNTNAETLQQLLDNNDSNAGSAGPGGLYQLLTLLIDFLSRIRSRYAT